MASVCMIFGGASTSLCANRMPCAASVSEWHRSSPKTPTALCALISTRVTSISYCVSSAEVLREYTAGADRITAAARARKCSFGATITTTLFFFLSAPLIRALTVSGLAEQLLREHVTGRHATEAHFPTIGRCSAESESSDPTASSKSVSETSPAGEIAALQYWKTLVAVSEALVPSTTPPRPLSDAAGGISPTKRTTVGILTVAEL
mmetsp:Transcript_75568/g.122746  ORF Transcript_75568/g.122746 Transcript_75568/m.122746 type:complete len:207 (+) Transcript_75568:1134-1754(+)